MIDQDDKKPREFWIEFTGAPSDEKECYKRYVSGEIMTTPFPDHEIVHVIEKSAYDSLQRELADLLLDHNALKSKLAEKDTEVDQ